MREAGVSSHTRLAIARAGGLPMRNNVGVAETADGRYVRFGLMNTSKQENERFKSSDIVSPIPILVQPHHVGRTFGVFGVFETKHPDWHLTPGDLRAQSQLRFINLVLSVGGLGGFVTDAAQVEHYIRSYNGV